MKLRVLTCLIFLPWTAAPAAPVVTNPTAGNVTTTSFTLCWETGEAAKAGIEVFSDAAGTQDITAGLRIEHQFLEAHRRELVGTPETRDTARSLQSGMDARGVFLTRVSDLRPDTPYWARALALDADGVTVDAGPLVEVTTARDSAFIAESRQLVVDFSGAAALLGSLDGAVARLDNAGSAHPLFAVINDTLAGNRCYFDLNHLLDATGERPLNPASGTTLTLDLSLVGTGPVSGEYEGNEVAYDGSALAARSSPATFTAAPSVNLVATADRDTALSGQPFTIVLRATDGPGTPLADFDRAVILESPAISGGSLTSEPLVDGILQGQPLVLTAPGNQTVTVRDPVSGAITTLDLEVLAYTYDNFRLHYYGDTGSPAGEPTANGDGDPYNNLVEFAQGLDPRINDGILQLDPGGRLLRRGGPLITLRIDSDGTDFRVTFLRSKNRQALGIRYNPQFSSNLDAWFDNPLEPTVLETDGDMELVTVPYPFFTPEPAKPRFFRMEFTID